MGSKFKCASQLHKIDECAIVNMQYNCEKSLEDIEEGGLKTEREVGT